MAVEIFLKLPGVKGEAQAKGHTDEIEVDSFSVGASNPTDAAKGSGLGAGKVNISGLTIHKQTDMSSVSLFSHCCRGTHFADATMTVREAGGDAPLEYYVVAMKQVFVSDIHWAGSAESGKPGEVVTLTCAEFKITYRKQNDKGGEAGKDELGWNLKTNAAAS